VQKIHTAPSAHSPQPGYYWRMDFTLLDLTERLRAAHSNGQALRIRGHGSKDFLADQLQGQLLDTSAHSGIVSYEPSELVVTVKAGTPLVELEAALAEQGQCLPFEPPHFKLTQSATGTGTVGGMVATGLSGPSRASVGAARDYVLGVQLLNGKAEHLQFGGTVMKNVAGYDVSRLIAGSWGMLGLITQVSIKVLGHSPAQATLCFEMPQHVALQQLNDWGGQPLPLNASNWVHDGGKDLLFVRLRGAVAAVEAACRSMLRQHTGTRMDNVQAVADWTLARHLQLPFFTPPSDSVCLWRISVPQTTPVMDMPSAPAAAQLVDWHGAQRWVWAPLEAGAQIKAAAQAAGGYATLFIASQAVNTWATSRFELLKPPLDHIHRQLKAEFDPQGIFNPGRTPWFA
jgi:glycolate oxidase FAD binding subunit